MLKIAYKGLQWTQVYFLSSLSSFTIALAVFLASKTSIDFNNNLSLIALLAGLFGGLGYIFFIKALEKGEASIVIPLTALYPAVTVILAFLILGEKISIYQVIGVILALIAIILISIE